jgi:sec-independent protein translocase protein TatB
MFGMGFMEIFLIAIVAIIALGPDKLPTAMVDIAKFVKKIKSGVEDAKTTLDTELNIKDMKDEANKFKAQIEDVKSTVKIDTKVDLGLDDLMKNDFDSDTDIDSNQKEVQEKSKKKKVSFKKEKKKKAEVNEFAENTDAANKFKVNFDEEKEDKA